jgi:hypothetical protein
VRLRGVNYDVGTAISPDYHSRPVWDLDVARAELAVVRNQLHCNAVRISGTDHERLLQATAMALDLGLQVWLSPQLHDADPPTTLAYTKECAQRAAALHDGRSELVYVLGSELTWFMRGIMPGATFQRRVMNPLGMAGLRWTDRPGRRLNAFLADAAAAVRAVFPGPVTYAAAPIERVDWRPFDYVALDYYRGAKNRLDYGPRLARHFAVGKPVVVTELGLCTYRGAELAGARGWAITEVVDGRLQIKGERKRDEELQARELIDMLTIVEATGVKGAFVFTFVSPALPHRADEPRHDLDLASYSLVKTRPTAEPGSDREQPAWEPKRSFHALAQHYGADR